MLRLVSEEIEGYAERHTRPEPEQLQALMAFTHAHMDCPQMLTGRPSSSWSMEQRQLMS